MSGFFTFARQSRAAKRDHWLRNVVQRDVEAESGTGHRTFAPLHFDRRGEIPEGSDPWYQMPVFNWHEGKLSTHYVRRYIVSIRRLDEVPRLTDKQLAAFDLLDEIAEDPRVQLRMDFEPGDMQFLHNPQILHDRTAYEDWNTTDKRRHLLRLWLCARMDGRCPRFMPGAGKPRDRQSGRYRSQRCYPTRSTDAVVGVLVSTPVALIAATLDSAKHSNDRRSAFSDEDRTISEKKYLAGGSYRFNDFDKYMCLSLGTIAWVVILFLMRPYVVLLVSMTNHSNRMEFIDLVYPDRLWLAIDTVAAIPAVILVVVTFLRRPNAAGSVKAIWKRGAPCYCIGSAQRYCRYGGIGTRRQP